MKTEEMNLPQRIRMCNSTAEDEWLANAAPDLLAACELFMQYDGENYQTGLTTYDDVKAAIQASISKAKGLSQ
jgi:hypothetical protein